MGRVISEYTIIMGLKKIEVLKKNPIFCLEILYFGVHVGTLRESVYVWGGGGGIDLCCLPS